MVSSKKENPALDAYSQALEERVALDLQVVPGEELRKLHLHSEIAEELFYKLKAAKKEIKVAEKKEEIAKINEKVAKINEEIAREETISSHQLLEKLEKMELQKAAPKQVPTALTRPELGSYVWLKRENGDWLTVFEGKELRWPVGYKPLANIQKLLQRPKEELDAYSLSDESQQKTGHGSTDIGALIEEGLSISAGPMSSGGQKISTPKARLLIEQAIQELRVERETTEDSDRQIEIDESLEFLDKSRKEIRNQFPDVAKGIKAIKTGIDRLINKIEPRDPKLAEHLRASIKRRDNCLVYEPTRQDIHWELAER